MKTKRQAMILQIVKDNEIETQEELADVLRHKGIEVTQATVSRDVKDLQLIKIPTGDGRYRYSVPFEPVVGDLIRRARRSFQEYVLDLDYSRNMIILKTLPGTANAVAASIDDLQWPQVLATIAGDDTILVIVKTEEEVPPAGPVLATLESLSKLRQNG
ncbi:MAG: arginine repressor [Firmicutes bacterium]|nr:arginine repressor [Bacillota bacterium]